MLKFRNPEIIKKELAHLRSIIQETQKFIEKYPDDPALKFALEQDLFREQLLLQELKESLLAQRRNVFLSFFENKPAWGMEITELSTYLSNLNKVFSAIAKKSHINVEFYLTELVPGSFGVLISSVPVETLFNYCEQIFKDFFVFIKAIQEKNFKIFQSEYKGLKSSYKDFINSLYRIKSNIRFEWETYTKKKETLTLHFDSIQYAFTEFVEKEEEVSQTFKIPSIIKGISLIKQEVEIVSAALEDLPMFREKKYLKAKFKKEQEEKIKVLLDKDCILKLEVKEKVNPITEEIKTEISVVDIL